MQSGFFQVLLGGSLSVNTSARLFLTNLLSSYFISNNAPYHKYSLWLGAIKLMSNLSIAVSYKVSR